MLIDLLTVIYLICALALMIFTLGIWILLGLWFVHRGSQNPLPTVRDEELPQVTVQLPIYNESAVAGRLIEAVTGLDYPRERLHIQILDDSTDETTEVISQLIRDYPDFHIQHIRRLQRDDYKAGALAYGLTQTDSEFVAIFDADFSPAPDFLLRTIPYFLQDQRLGIIQGRWGHLNAEQNFITRSQAMSIDGHFVVEQTARNRGGLLLSFNGTGGVWRSAAIRDAGGWSGNSLAEDLDLSYRAQLRGWRFLYLPEVEVPAEVPPQIAAYKRQQARWAKGTTQNLLHLLRPVVSSPDLNLLQKFMAVLHLCQYLPQVLILILVVLTPLLMLAGVLDKLPLAPLGIIGMGPPLMYFLSQRHLYCDWPRRLLAFPLLLVIGSGVVFSNSVAILEAFMGRSSEFKRTPKFSDSPWQQSAYALRPDWTTLVEMILAIYLLAGAGMAFSRSPGIVPFLMTQSLGFFTIAGWSLFESFQMRRYLLRTKPA